ncbi:MAG: hypothetical protein QHH74_07675 [Spirochaetota bacterium]|nr:hypothetical protein [Spirochaetota bacterium]
MNILEELKGYFETRLNECKTNQELNKHQIAAYTAYLEKLDSIHDDDYGKVAEAIGDMFLIARAEQRDRYESLKRIKTLFGDSEGVKAEQIMIDAVQASSNHTELYSNISRAKDDAGVLIQNTHRALELIVKLITQCVEYHVSCKSRKQKRKAEVVAIWNELQQCDPEITVDKIMMHKPYCRVIPFDNERLSLILSWPGEVL